MRLTVDGASLVVLENSLTADEFTLEKSGSDVTVSATNLNFLLQAGGTRILSLSNGDVTFKFTSTGFAGAVTNAAARAGPGRHAGVAGTVALVPEHDGRGQTLLVGGNNVTVPGGTSFVAWS